MSDSDEIKTNLLNPLVGAGLLESEEERLQRRIGIFELVKNSDDEWVIDLTTPQDDGGDEPPLSPPRGVVPTQLEPETLYTLSNWDTVVHIKHRHSCLFETIRVMGTPLTRGQKYLLIKPNF